MGTSKAAKAAKTATSGKAGKSGKSGKAGKSAKVARLPKKECCVSRTTCGRCPLRMLREGTLPEGYTVKKRKLVKVRKKADPRVAA